MTITTSLGKDALLLTELKGHEEISGLFRFDLKVLAELKKPAAFDKLLGQPATVEIVLADGKKRYVDGIVSSMRQGHRDERFLHYGLELVPKLWLLTLRQQSRIFQRLTVPEILRKVLAGIEIQVDLTAAYEPRDFCVQYRESDFAFASRLMEEEGIRYYFIHSEGSHLMVLADEATKHPDVPLQSEVTYEEAPQGGKVEEMRVTAWEKVQEVRPHLYTLRDHCFQLPDQNLEAEQPTLVSVPVGKVSHKLNLLGSEKLEVYDFPGGYAQRFDGIDSGGQPRPADLQKIFPDKERTVRLRMEREECATLHASGESYCPQFMPGHAFELKKHFNADGRYAVTRVEHEAFLPGNYATGDDGAYRYGNRFECIPAALPCRPERRTPRPVIAGNQTATVVAPPGEQLFCDKYGRVKVQFHWDREGKKDPGSSCWIRVAQPWAGKGWGAFFWPRAGNEVVVSFEEGDPDQPLVVGSVYNADNMPPFALPTMNQLGGIKSASLRGQFNRHFNGVVFCDEQGREHMALHSERNLTFNTELDNTFSAGQNKHEGVSGASLVTVGYIPGGGGSGGGPDDNPETEERLAALESPSYSAWGPVNPAGVPGLYSTMTYGAYLGSVVGLQEYLTVGSNMNMIINPTALTRFGGKPPFWIEGLAGGGLGGNLAFTMGSNSNITLGPNVAVKSTDDIEYRMDGHVGSKILCAIIAAAIILWTILYATVTSIRDRVIEFAAFQAVISVALTALTVIEASMKYFKDEVVTSLWWTYKMHVRVRGQVWGGGAATAKVLRDVTFGIVGTLASIAMPIGAAAGVAITESNR
jgi:type VI secretion system secreted protein VgrG